MGEITIKINKDGSQVSIDAENFSDSSCGEIQDRLASAIGVLTSSDKKPEFFHNGSVNIGG